MAHWSQRLLSHLHPIPIAEGMGLYGPLELTLERGRYVVNSPNANQSQGSLHRIMRAALRTAMAGGPAPRDVLVLGLGAGSAIDVLRDDLGHLGPITGVEREPLMLRWGREHFGLARHKDLSIVEADAEAWLASAPPPADLVVVDLFEDDRVPAWLGARSALDLLRSATRSGGTLVFNTMPLAGAQAELVDRIEQGLRERFDRLERLVLEGTNAVFIAR